MEEGGGKKEKGGGGCSTRCQTSNEQLPLNNC